MLDREMYEIVSNQLDVDVKLVEELDKFFWKELKKDLNNPDADVIEVPFLGSFSITRAKMNSTIKYSLRILRKMKEKNIRLELKGKLHEKNIRDLEIQKELFRNLWRLKQKIY